jgi:hypothetical protein
MDYFTMLAAISELELCESLLVFYAGLCFEGQKTNMNKTGMFV